MACARRKRVRLGQIPLAQAKSILAEHYQDIVAGKFPGETNQKCLSTRRRIRS